MIYSINLDEYTPVGSLSGPCWCGQGPVYPVMEFAPGDVVDFGSVQISAVLQGHAAPWEVASYYQGSVTAAFGNESIHVNHARNSGGVTFTADSSRLFDLVYTIPDGVTSIQIGWDGPGIYTPAAAVPEPATWALLLLGFMVVAFKRMANEVATAAAVRAQPASAGADLLRARKGTER